MNSNTTIDELSSLFKSEIKDKDKPDYDKFIFRTFYSLNVVLTSLDSAFDNKKQFKDSLIKINPTFEYLDEESLNLIYSHSKPLALHGICMTIIENDSSFFDLVPKSGIFCDRKAIAKNWINYFFNQVSQYADSNKEDISVVFFRHVIDYLVSYHNDRFYFRNDESQRESVVRILDQLKRLI